MPFFQELEIIQNTVNSRNTSGNFNRQAGLSGRTTGNSNYESETLQFPLDIGSADKGHYLMFNINAQKKTQFTSTVDRNVTPTVIRNIKGLQDLGGPTNISNDEFNKKAGTVLSLGGGFAENVLNIVSAVPVVGNLLSPFFAGDAGRALTTGVKDFGNDLSKVKSAEFLRTIERTRDTVVLYMPNKITYSNAQTYIELDLGGSVKSLAGGSALASTLAGAEPKNAAMFAAFGIAELANSKSLEALATAVTQVVKNPMLEVMYKGVSLRKFNFSFSLWPRSEKEAFEVQKIIELLKFHQAPEIKNNTGGFFLIPPSEFDISFMYNGRVNQNIEPISTCVLTNITVDYTPKGFHAYESIGSIDKPELGGTGMPVGIGLSLSFLETQIITKDNYKPYNRKIFQSAP